MDIDYSLPIEKLSDKVLLAVMVIRPDSVFMVGETYDSLVWKDSTSKPTEAEFDQAVADFHQKYNAMQYVRDRKAEYPSQQECVYAILDDDLTALQAKRAEVKKKYPKP